MKLQMRYQSILIRPYVLACLGRYEDAKKVKDPPMLSVFNRKSQQIREQSSSSSLEDEGTE